MTNRASSKYLHRTLLAVSVAIFCLAMPICVSPALSAEKAVPAEKNPPGDIPDSQVFIDYASPQGFTLKVPEGWARADRADGTSFIDKFDGIVVSVTKADALPSIDSAKTDYVAKLEAK